MLDYLINRWWILAVRGVVAVLFGIMAFLQPHLTLTYLVSLFGIFALADGFFTMGAAIALNWLTLFCEGVVGAAIALLVFVMPETARVMIVYFIVAWALVTGGLELAGVYGLRKSISRAIQKGEWLLGVSGLLTIGLGVLAAALASSEVTTFMRTVGVYAVVSGALFVALAFNVRTWPHTA